MDVYLDGRPLTADESPSRVRWLAWGKTIVLLGLGIYFISTIVSGNLNNYINLRFAWLSYLAAGLFLLLGAFSLVTALRPPQRAPFAGDPTHVQAGWGIIAIIAVPLVLGTLIPSQPLGVDAVGGIDITGSAAQVSAGNAATTFTINPLDRNVLDWLRVFNQTADPAALNGEPVDVIGFVYVEPGYPDNQFMTARFTISCCVADANAIGLPVQWADAPALAQGQWVRVTGTMQTGEFQGKSTPIVVADHIELIEQPKNPYLYP
jgi:uncharacterized repeat protein (TIGR03943 family)